VTPLETERLVLRGWRETDLAPFAALNADPRVMEYLPSPLSASESDAFAARIRDHFDAHGYGLYAVEERETAAFLGFVGLNRTNFDAHFTPAVEIGWRLAYEAWGRGFASEAARACLQYAFVTLALPEVVSFTAVDNRRSAAVMQRIGMHRDPAEDFDHPKMPPGHRLRRHVLYRITAEDWRRATSAERRAVPLRRRASCSRRPRRGSSRRSSR